MGSCKFVDIVKHIGPHQGIDQGASTKGAVRVRARCGRRVSHVKATLIISPESPTEIQLATTS